jgi:hypothetical protein
LTGLGDNADEGRVFQELDGSSSVITRDESVQPRMFLPNSVETWTDDNSNPVKTIVDHFTDVLGVRVSGHNYFQTENMKQRFSEIFLRPRPQFQAMCPMKTGLKPQALERCFCLVCLFPMYPLFTKVSKSLRR